MPKKPITREPHELICRQNARAYIFYALPFLVLLIVGAFEYKEMLAFFHSSPVGAVFLLSMYLLFILYFGHISLDRRIKLVINKKGIWTRKHKLIPWNDIESYHFKTLIGPKGGSSTKLFIQPKIICGYFKCDISFLDCGVKEISDAIDINASDYHIRRDGVQTKIS